MQQKKSNNSDTIRLGHINYANSLPIYDAIFEKDIPFSGKIISDHPAELNHMIINDMLDISPVSSIEYARNQEKLLLLNGLCINSHGAVYSVLLASSLPLNKLNGKRIGLTENSATAQVIVRILLQDIFGFHCEFVTIPFEKCGLLEGVDAELIIGDAAFLYKDKTPYCYDLAEEWLNATGKSVVFAVWVVRKEFALKFPELVLLTENVLLESYHHLNKPRILKKSKGILKIKDKEINNYFSALGYDFNQSMKDSLLYFYQKAHRINLAPACNHLQFWN